MLKKGYSECLRGESFHPGMKISLNFTLGIFIGVI